MLSSYDTLILPDSGFLQVKGKDADQELLLIDRAVSGNLQAFNQLVLNYQDLVYHHVYSICQDSAQAEDVTQDSLIRGYLKIKQFRGGSFRAWLLKIATNQAFDLLRQSRRRQTIPLFPDDEQGEEIDSTSWLVDPGSSVEEVVERKQLRDQIQRALNELPEVYRTAINLIDIFELDYKEAAYLLNVPVGTLKSRLARARRMMQLRL